MTFADSNITCDCRGEMVCVCSLLHLWLCTILIFILKPVKVPYYSLLLCSKLTVWNGLSMKTAVPLQWNSEQQSHFSGLFYSSGAWCCPMCHVQTLETPVMLLLLSPHSEALEGPWWEGYLFNARIQICIALFSGEAVSLVSVEPQVNCQSVVLCSLSACLSPFLKDGEADGLAVTLELGQNFAMQEEWEELQLQWEWEGECWRRGNVLKRCKLKVTLFLYCICIQYLLMNSKIKQM